MIMILVDKYDRRNFHLFSGNRYFCLMIDSDWLSVINRFTTGVRRGAPRDDEDRRDW